uniref:Uncharacterized protein n=1 Tax=Fundulus heteroclitus TaxID=8078 RepID=A0A3Q2TSP4_FUNHE
SSYFTKKIIMIGKWSDTTPATDHIQELCDKVKPEAEKKTGRDFREFKAFFVGDEYLHLWVIESISTGELVIELLGVQQHHKWDDPLKPFDENN